MSARVIDGSFGRSAGAAGSVDERDKRYAAAFLDLEATIRDVERMAELAAREAMDLTEDSIMDDIEMAAFTARQTLDMVRSMRRQWDVAFDGATERDTEAEA